MLILWQTVRSGRVRRGCRLLSPTPTLLICQTPSLSTSPSISLTSPSTSLTSPSTSLPYPSTSSLKSVLSQRNHFMKSTCPPITFHMSAGNLLLATKCTYCNFQVLCDKKAKNGNNERTKMTGVLPGFRGFVARYPPPRYPDTSQQLSVSSFKLDSFRLVKFCWLLVLLGQFINGKSAAVRFHKWVVSEGKRWWIVVCLA